MFGIGARPDVAKRNSQTKSDWAYIFRSRAARLKSLRRRHRRFYENELTLALTELKNTLLDETLIYDEDWRLPRSHKTDNRRKALSKNQEITTDIQKTLDKINAAYDALKDKTFRCSFFPVSSLNRKARAKFCKSSRSGTFSRLEAWSAIQFFGKETLDSFKTPARA